MVLKEGNFSPSTGFTEYNVLVIAASRDDWQDELMNQLMWPLKSVKGQIKEEMFRLRAALASERWTRTFIQYRV